MPSLPTVWGSVEVGKPNFWRVTAADRFRFVVFSRGWQNRERQIAAAMRRHAHRGGALGVVSVELLLREEVRTLGGIAWDLLDRRFIP